MKITRTGNVSTGIELPWRWIAYFMTQPETGMGYQIVDIMLEDGTPKADVAIHNCSIVSNVGGAPVDFDPNKIAKIEVKNRHA